MTRKKLSAAERRRYIDERLNTDWGWKDYEKQLNGYSLQDIINSMARVFGIENVPRHPQAIKRDIDRLREAAQLPDEEEITEAQRLLQPENFPEFRRLLRGDEYETPKFQMALFWMLYALTFKVAAPQWVIDYLDELDPKNPFPEDLNDLIVRQEIMLSFLFLLAPRHGKTDLLQDFQIFVFCKDPNRKILFGNGTIKRTEGFVQNYIIPVLESHEELNRLYGPFKSDDRAWSRSGFVLAGRTGFHKSMSLQPFGISGSVLSLDADLELADDISDLRRALSETTTDDDVDWMTTQLMTRREPETAFAYVGSHVVTQTGDLFERIEAKKDELNIGDHRLIIKKIPAHRYELCDPDNDPEHTGCVLWPTKRPFSFLEAMRGLMGDDDMFEAVYNQVPRQRQMLHFPGPIMRSNYIHMDFDEESGLTPPPDRKEHKIGVLDRRRSWGQLPVVCCKKETAVGLGFDPAASERKGASFTALTVKAACTRCGRRYWVDYDAQRMSPEGHPEFMGFYLQQYPQIEVVTIEINAYQKALARDPRMDKLQSEYGFYLKEFNTDERKHSPEYGIPNYGRHYKSGMVSVPYATAADHDLAEPLLKAFIRWPQKPNDLPMSAWLNDLGLSDILEQSRYTEAELMPGQGRWMSDFHAEQTYEVDLSEDFLEGDWIYR